MKKLGILIAILTFVMAAGAAGLAFGAPVVDMTQSVTAQATVGGITSLTVTPSSITYTAFGSNAWPSTPSNNKVVITYASNNDPWKIRVYTNNTVVPNFAQTNGRYSKGGLAKIDGKLVIPMKWIAKAGGSTTPAISGISTYNFIKDKRDEDDPATTTQNEAWSDTDGYPNIAYGNTSGGVCVDPNGVNFQGDAITGTIDMYIAALFSSQAPSAGSYSSAINFDLLHE